MAKKKQSAPILEEPGLNNAILEGMEDSIAELEEELAPEEKPATEAPEEPASPPAPEETAPEPSLEEEPEELPADEKARNQAFAQLRRDKKAAEERAAAIERELLERKAYAEGAASVQPKPQAPVVTDPEPDKLLEREDWLEWRQRKLDAELAQVKQLAQEQANQSALLSARQELRELEDEYTKQAPDYMAAKEYLKKTEAAAIKALYPQATDAMVKQYLDRQELLMASQAVQNKANPSDVFYKMAQARGYTGKPATPTPPTPPKPGSNLQAIAENKRRSANLISGTNAGKPNGVSSEQVASAAFSALLSMKDSDWDGAFKDSMGA